MKNPEEMTPRELLAGLREEAAWAKAYWKRVSSAADRLQAGLDAQDRRIESDHPFPLRRGPVQPASSGAAREPQWWTCGVIGCGWHVIPGSKDSTGAWKRHADSHHG
jgi:hypothetical protein